MPITNRITRPSRKQERLKAQLWQYEELIEKAIFHSDFNRHEGLIHTDGLFKSCICCMYYLPLWKNRDIISLFITIFTISNISAIVLAFLTSISKSILIFYNILKNKKNKKKFNQQLSQPSPFIFFTSTSYI